MKNFGRTYKCLPAAKIESRCLLLPNELPVQVSDTTMLIEKQLLVKKMADTRTMNRITTLSVADLFYPINEPILSIHTATNCCAPRPLLFLFRNSSS